MTEEEDEDADEDDDEKPARSSTETSGQAGTQTSAKSASPANPGPSAQTARLSRSAAIGQREPETALETPPQDEQAQAERSEADKEKERWGRNRMLGGHLFPAATFVPLALSASYVGIRAGAEYHAIPDFVRVVSLSFTPRLQRVNLQTVNVAENVDFAVRLHDYFAIFGDAYGRGRVGANIETLLGTGAEYTYGGDLGALIKVVRIGSVQFAIRGYGGYYAGQKAGIMRLFNDLSVIATNAVTRLKDLPTLDLNTALAQLNSSFSAATADLLMPFHGIGYGVSLNMALALGKYIGLQGSLGFAAETTTFQPTEFSIDATGVGRSVVFESTEQTTRPSLSAALDLDAGPLGLPIDILVEYRASPVSVYSKEKGISKTESSFESLAALGVYYSGRADLQLGVTGYTLLGQAPVLGAKNAAGQPIASSQPQDFGAQLVFRYYW